MNIRKLVALCSSLLLICCLLCACSQNAGAPSADDVAASASTAQDSAPEASASAPEEASNASGSAAQDRPIRIGIVQLAENGTFTDMREGFLDQLENQGISVETDYKNAQGDVGTLNTICQEMANSDNDIVVTIATPAAQAYVSQESDIPLFFISVTDPVNAGIMSALDQPDHNATGSSNLVPVDEIFALAANLTPDAKNFGILYNSGEANAVSTVENAKKYLDDNGYTYTEATVTNSSEIQQAVQALVSKVDAIYVPIDSTVQTGMAQAAQIATDAGIPIYGSAPVMVQDGALATVSVNDAQVGAATADLVAEYLSGTPISDIAAVTVGDFIVVVNDGTAHELGIEIPENLGEVIHVG